MLKRPFVFSDLVRITLIGVLVGIIAGVGAIIFYATLEFSTQQLLGFTGFKLPDINGNWVPPDPLKLIFIILALLNIATLWMAIAADMGASLLVIFNGLKLLGGKNN